VLQNVADGIVTAGEGGLIESFNRSARGLLGYREEEVIGQPLELIVAPSHHGEFSETARANWSLPDAKEIRADSTATVGCRKDGSCFPMETDISQTRIGERMFTIACLRDISGRKAYTEALEDRALHDELTGLANRSLFADRVDRTIAVADRADESRAVLLVDLEKFRETNETLGRENGDALLQGVAGRLRGAMRDTDTVGRLGRDSFGIAPSDNTDLEAAATIAWKIRAMFEHPFLVSGEAVHLQASIGIALFPQHGRSSSRARGSSIADDSYRAIGRHPPAVGAPHDDLTGNSGRLVVLHGRCIISTSVWCGQTYCGASRKGDLMIPSPGNTNMIGQARVSTSTSQGQTATRPIPRAIDQL
jgi:diguanylate cyclase (GGDEF)-like protein/PAS domain S-box-containing protein